MTRDVEPRLRELDACGCGCGEYGTLKKPWRSNGVRCVAHKCKCKQCVGGRQPGNARRRENKIAKATGGTREPMSGNLSGIDGRAGLDEWEETMEKAVVRGFRRWVESKTVTSKLARLMARRGSRRHFILTWDGKPRWVVTPFEDWAEFVKESD